MKFKKQQPSSSQYPNQLSFWAFKWLKFGVFECHKRFLLEIMRGGFQYKIVKIKKKITKTKVGLN